MNFEGYKLRYKILKGLYTLYLHNFALNHGTSLQWIKDTFEDPDFEGSYDEQFYKICGEFFRRKLVKFVDPDNLKDKIIKIENENIVACLDEDGVSFCDLKFNENDFIDGSDVEHIKTDLIHISSMLVNRRNAIISETEDQTNDRYADALRLKGYRVADQSRGGDSESGASAGSRDIVINDLKNRTATIIEAFILKSLDKAVINRHVEKLTKKYDAEGNSRNFILVYSKSNNTNLWSNYVQHINGSFGGFTDTSVEDSQKANIKTGKSCYGGREIYHIFIIF